MNRIVVKILAQILLLAVLVNARALTDSKSSSKLIKRSVVDNSEESIRSDELNDGYDEYPIVTPKRAAMLLDRIMVALHHALEDTDTEGSSSRKINEVYRNGRYYSGRQQKTSSSSTSGKKPTLQYKEKEVDELELPEDFVERSLDSTLTADQTGDGTMDLQRRGHDGAGGGASSGLPSKGRVYWRCYFNAVTCF